MTAGGASIRRCPECGEEFQPHVIHCSDCGALLEDRFEGEVSPEEPDVVAPDPGEYAAMLSGLTLETAEQAAQHLSDAGISFRLAHHRRYGVRLGVKVEDAPAAVSVLVRAGLLPEQPDPSEPPVGTEGGLCPACGHHVAPGTDLCPDCGLQLMGGVSCPRCGAELSPVSGQCPDCDREED